MAVNIPLAFVHLSPAILSSTLIRTRGLDNVWILTLSFFMNREPQQGSGHRGTFSRISIAVSYPIPGARTWWTFRVARVGRGL